MAICPFSVWTPISGGVGPYSGGPFKIVHHTTEGSTKEGAFGAFRSNRSDPHFTVDSNGIYQHINTSLAARALRNLSGGVQTNKDSAVQIEVVGFAHIPKNINTLKNVARLCRWIESTHHVAQAWPNGLPKVATSSGHDPGGHNRNAQNWDTKSGHYGHCHVPENTHWDPGYSLQEVNFVMEADFDDNGALLHEKELTESYQQLFSRVVFDLTTATSTMPDHNEFGSAEEEYERY